MDLRQWHRLQALELPELKTWPLLAPFGPFVADKLFICSDLRARKIESSWPCQAGILNFLALFGPFWPFSHQQLIQVERVRRLRIQTALTWGLRYFGFFGPFWSFLVFFQQQLIQTELVRRSKIQTALTWGLRYFEFLGLFGPFPTTNPFRQNGLGIRKLGRFWSVLACLF